MCDGGAGKEDRMRGTGTRFEGRLEIVGGGGSGGSGCWRRWAIDKAGIAGQNKEVSKRCLHKNNAVNIM